MAMAEIVIREAALFGAEEDGCAGAGGDVFMDEPGAGFEAVDKAGRAGEFLRLLYQ